MTDSSHLTAYVCLTCATQYEPSAQPPASCPICEDPRQYVGSNGQEWTTHDELLRDHANRVETQGAFLGIGATPDLAINQRALLVPHGESNLLWDLADVLDEDTAQDIERRGGLSGIAISHPHYYSSMVDWAHRFDCPIHLHAEDSEWIMRSDPAIELWSGDSLDLGHGLTAVRVGGHYPGMNVLHVAEGDGTLLSADLPLPVRDKPWVTFMWSYPNMVPLPAAEVQRIAATLGEYEYDALHGAFWHTEIPTDASAAVARSAERYVAALERPAR